MYHNTRILFNISKCRYIYIYIYIYTLYSSYPVDISYLRCVVDVPEVLVIHHITDFLFASFSSYPVHNSVSQILTRVAYLRCLIHIQDVLFISRMSCSYPSCLVYPMSRSSPLTGNCFPDWTGLSDHVTL